MAECIVLFAMLGVLAGVFVFAFWEVAMQVVWQWVTGHFWIVVPVVWVLGSLALGVAWMRLGQRIASREVEPMGAGGTPVYSPLRDHDFDDWKGLKERLLAEAGSALEHR